MAACWNVGRYSSTHPVAFQGFGGVFLLLSEAVRALRLVEDVGRKLLALRHGAREKITPIHMSAVPFKIGVSADTDHRTSSTQSPATRGDGPAPSTHPVDTCPHCEGPSSSLQHYTRNDCPPFPVVTTPLSVRRAVVTCFEERFIRCVENGFARRCCHLGADWGDGAWG